MNGYSGTRPTAPLLVGAVLSEGLPSSWGVSRALDKLRGDFLCVPFGATPETAEDPACRRFLVTRARSEVKDGRRFRPRTYSRGRDLY